jgi:SAM-dependent methyltransferase
LNKNIDTLPRTSRRADASYLDFVEGLRAYVLDDETFPAAANQAIAASGLSESDLNIDQIRQTIGPLPATQMNNRLMRSQQEMKWRRITATFDAQHESLEAELDEFANQHPQGLELDPNFVQPAYTNVHFHLQPDGYYKHPLAGVRYHYGTKVFFRGDNDKDQLHGKLIKHTPAPADGNVKRILDLACSVGQSTTALKAKYPDAQVWGVDHSAPMLKAAHRRAVLLESDVTFSQRLAEDTRFEDAEFDLVFAFILFHELPKRIIEETVREAARVLRPGGLFVVYDFCDSASMSPLEIYHRDFDARHNGEAYSQDFCDMDLTALMGESGFEPIDTSMAGGYVKRWFATRAEEQ